MSIRSPVFTSYTFGPALRIPDVVKNMGKDFAPEDLRISPRPMGSPRYKHYMTTLCTRGGEGGSGVGGGGGGVSSDSTKSDVACDTLR